MRIADLRIDGTPTRAHVDAAALEQPGAYPPSYRAFVAHAGWGRLFGLWLVLPPVLPGHADGLPATGDALTAFVRADYADSRADDFDWVIEPDGSWDLVEHLVVFGISENGHHLLWDTSRRDAAGEFAVWVSDRGQSLRRLGDDLEAALPLLSELAGPLAPAGHDVSPLPATRAASGSAAGAGHGEG
ncbi:hypothetical protein G7070_02660 [Propioniciclava coleopterorum]|uniref:SMI1/KNR4 family protein n=1 Tax=Propioniciclava coleopterorum TaxID=2714937 RepID=A0A6G7Y416_9ACTN|nr:hypothetical protein [Propioniciclava coleopterorum]QIK71388.1 hypothetical protein G7070_02660 [Propioniciclava coleopterorum]